MKKCSKCGETKDFSKFPRRKDSPDGFRNECKLCRLNYQRKWHKEGPRTYQDSTGKKQCRKCLEILDTSRFGKSTQNKDGLKSYCKMCNNTYNKKYSDENPEYYRKWRDANKDRLKDNDRKYREKNKETIIAKRKEYVAANKKIVSEKKKEWYEKNKKRIIANKKKRRQTNIQLRLAESLRRRLYCALKRNSKVGSAVRDLGCTIDEFKKYIESKFSPGMSWDNYGTWHLDHYMPLSSFDLTKREQLKKACHYTNLQPLWAEDNLKKGAKLPNKE